MQSLEGDVMLKNNWIVNIHDMTCYNKARNNTFKIKHENNKIYFLYECPHSKHDQWHECVPEILYEHIRALTEDILLGD